jgi:hypothetical protein
MPKGVVLSSNTVEMRFARNGLQLEKKLQLAYKSAMGS